MQQLQHAGRNMDHRMPVARPRFQQSHARAGLAQPAGDDAARRPGADNDIIRVHRCQALAKPSQRANCASFALITCHSSPCAASGAGSACCRLSWRLGGEFLSHTLGKVHHQRIGERNAAGACKIGQHAAQFGVRRQLDQRGASLRWIVAQSIGDAHLDARRAHVGRAAAAQRAGVRRRSRSPPPRGRGT